MFCGTAGCASCPSTDLQPKSVPSGPKMSHFTLNFQQLGLDTSPIVTSQLLSGVHQPRFYVGHSSENGMCSFLSSHTFHPCYYQDNFMSLTDQAKDPWESHTTPELLLGNYKTLKSFNGVRSRRKKSRMMTNRNRFPQCCNVQSKTA